jgi:hypothetical protein
MLDRWFLSHPRSVGETYWAHLRAALGFAGALFAASLACSVHAVFPGLFVRTGSRAVDKIHTEMVSNRAPLAAGPPAGGDSAAQPWADYAI